MNVDITITFRDVDPARARAFIASLGDVAEVDVATAGEDPIDLLPCGQLTDEPGPPIMNEPSFPEKLAAAGVLPGAVRDAFVIDDEPEDDFIDEPGTPTEPEPELSEWATTPEPEPMPEGWTPPPAPPAVLAPMDHACLEPGCIRGYDTALGLDRHMQRTHGKPATPGVQQIRRPVAPVLDKPTRRADHRVQGDDASPADPGYMLLRCNGCKYAVGTVNASLMRHHARHVHDRDAYDDELRGSFG